MKNNQRQNKPRLEVTFRRDEATDNNSTRDKKFCSPTFAAQFAPFIFMPTMIFKKPIQYLIYSYRTVLLFYTGFDSFQRQKVNHLKSDLIN